MNAFYCRRKSWGQTESNLSIKTKKKGAYYTYYTFYIIHIIRIILYILHMILYILTSHTNKKLSKINELIKAVDDHPWYKNYQYPAFPPLASTCLILNHMIPSLPFRWSKWLWLLSLCSCSAAPPSSCWWPRPSSILTSR